MQKKDTTPNRNHFISPIVFCATCLVITACFFVLRGHFLNGYSKVSDFVIDTIVLQGSGKTGEWTLFWLLLLLGSLCIVFGCVLFYKISSPFNRTIQNLSTSSVQPVLGPEQMHPQTVHSSNPVFALACLLPAVLQLLLYADVSYALLLYCLTCAFCTVCFGEKALSHIACILCLYFDGLLLNLCLMHFTGRTVPDNIILLLTAACYMAFAAYLTMHQKDKADTVSEWLMRALQLPLPLLLLLYTKDTYQTATGVVTLGQPVLYRLMIYGFIAVLFGMFFLFIIQKKQGICICSAISIFLFGSYQPACYIVPSDMHHHGEQLLPFFELTKYHAMPYIDFSPVSGLYPLPIGFTNSLLGGTASTYSFAFVLNMLLWATIVIICIRMHASGELTLLFAFLFHMPAYCRTWMILPVMLVLLHPRVRQNTRHFLCCYVLCAFVSGLYYPLFGFALLAGFLPYALIKLTEYVRKGCLSGDSKKPFFYLEIAMTALPILVCIPMLLRMAKHVMTYSSQTLLGDGLSVRDVSIPSWFLPYVADGSVKQALYECIRLIGPMLPIWLLLLMIVTFVMTTKSGQASIKRTICALCDSPLMTGCVCAVIALPVCYTYTMVIMDEDWVSRLFSRSGHVYLWVAIVISVLLLHGEAGQRLSKAKVLLATILISTALLAFADTDSYAFPSLDGRTNNDMAAIGHDSPNSRPFALNDTYAAISEADMAAFPKLGPGFIRKETLTTLYDYKQKITTLRTYDENLTIMGLSPYQMVYYLLDEKCPYSGKPSLCKSSKAAAAAISQIDSRTAIGSDLHPLGNYYIYKYLLDNHYGYDAASGFFLPPALFAKVCPGQQPEASLMTSPWAELVYLGKGAATLGHNVDMLSAHLMPDANFPESPASERMLYVKLDTAALSDAFAAQLSSDSILKISWGTDRYMLADYADGEWLLPLCTSGEYAQINACNIYISLYDANTQTSGQPVLIDSVALEMQYYRVVP